VPLVLGTLVLRVVIWFFTALTNPWRAFSKEKFATAGEPGAAQDVIVQLRQRATKMRIVAAFTLFLILAFLAGGLYVFSQAESAASSAEAERQAYQISALSDEITVQQRKLGDLQTQFDQETDSAKKDALKALINRTQRLVDDYNAKLKVLSNTIAASAGEKNQTAYLLTVLSTKIGSALMLLFLIQILVSLYRYNTRVASFYDGRADTLQLVPIDQIDNLCAVCSILSPDKVDFGKMPATPFQHVIEMTKELLSAKAKVI
jgi:cbb3-type cytochrome oxidase subunit 3